MNKTVLQTSNLNGMLHRFIIIFFSLIVFSLNAFSLDFTFKEKIQWQKIQKIQISNEQSLQRLSFEGAFFPNLDSQIHFAKQYAVHTANAEISTSIANAVYVKADSLEQLLFTEENRPEAEITIKSDLIVSRKQPFAIIEFIPLRWNAEKRIVEKLVKFDLIIDIDDNVYFNEHDRDYTDNSVLSQGDWFKIRVDKGGVYKLTYSQLQEMGFDVSVPVSKIALYGNGGGTLPEINTDFRFDDLVENPIEIVGGADGTFDAGDYILFYGDDPVKWKYSVAKEKFYHLNNYYDDYSYYFITAITEGTGKRIVSISPPQGPATIEVNDFNDYQYYERDELNLAGSGRLWLGEIFDFNDYQTFDFEFPNTIKTKQAKFYGAFASRAYSTNQFLISINGVDLKTQSMPQTNDSGYEYGRTRDTEFNFTPKSDNLSVGLKYQRTSNSSTGYLDYLEINLSRELIFEGNQMYFRKVFGWEVNEIVKYIIDGASENLTIWEISDPTNIIAQTTSYAQGKVTFRSQTDTQREFIAFNGAEYYIPEFVETVGNQNLHAIKNIDYLIIAYPDFLDEANRLAEFHKQDNDFIVYVTTPNKIYNEFSSGSQDISAIRDFVKMLYDKSSPGKEIQYLLLFGDASYDYKDRLPDNTNMVPCWEHKNSLNIISSIATDDYFGYLDDGEGGMDDKNSVDIGIGRFVVATVEESEMAVDKSISYCTNTIENMGSWRNQITFIADDEDNNRHMHDAETLSGIVEDDQVVYNIDKIYLDAYPQVSTPSGQRAPQVNNAINTKMETGTLIFNYSGHGGQYLSQLPVSSAAMTTPNAFLQERKFSLIQTVGVLPCSQRHGQPTQVQISL